MIHWSLVIPAHACIPGVLSELLARQPTSPGKVRLGWQLAVGPAVARAARPDLRPDGTLRIRVADPHWRREIDRSRDLILARLQTLLGREAVRRLVMERQS
jgi:predicted nucleic acid-binding Zn ribbon protein